MHAIRWQQLHSVMEATLMMPEQKRVFKGRTQSVQGQQPEPDQCALYSRLQLKYKYIVVFLNPAS